MRYGHLTVALQPPRDATPDRKARYHDPDAPPRIEPVTDEVQYGVVENWSFAETGKGDCEDYVLEKRRELIRRGWPMSSLLITVVIDKEGGGHAVLTVVTDRGEFILDNQTDAVLPWSSSELTFIRGPPDRFTSSARNGSGADLRFASVRAQVA